MSPLRVMFFGMDGVFSRAPLAALLDSDQVCAVIVPRPMQSLPAAEPIRLLPPPNAPESDVPILFQPNELNAIGMAWNRGIPVYEVESLSQPRTQAILADLKPDVICVACFPRLLPPKLLRLPKYGALNLHPSLLPAYRGPSPLFWIFHDGLEHAGITVHRMTEQADAGDIVTQERIALPDGIRYGEAERIGSERGARLLVQALRAIEAGTFAHTPQPQIQAPRAPNPTDADYILTPDWSARRAFNFIRGMAESEHPILLDVGAERFVVKQAVAYDEQATLSVPFEKLGEQLQVRCLRGVLTVVVSRADSFQLR